MILSSVPAYVFLCLFSFRKNKYRCRWLFSWNAHLPCKKVTNANLSIPSVGSRNGPLKPPPTYFRWVGCPQSMYLEILPSGDIAGMSTSSIMPFHNVDPLLVHWFSPGRQNWARGVIFVGKRHPSLEFDCLLPLKEYSTVPHAIYVVRKSWNAVSAHVRSPRYWQQGSSAHQHSSS